ncbi:HBL280Cp [Eremothecium sinecaudum]|uniref:HBL280Cp n=1 Tax=Eremothecium sinecaudum TaxID=45286 RepID=A0A109UWU8_9SACH|nr:HBL280Cp [Eremothecium sinecaudum]AMD18622.1 HBL280Cp [Eremothecium sinecaudum]
MFRYSTVRSITPYSRQFSSTARALFAPGTRIPAGLQGIHENSPGNSVEIADQVSNGKFIIVGVPAAFSPACSAKHVPGYIKLLPEFKKKGITEIFVTAVNDSFVTKAWAEQLKCPPGIRMLADTQGTFANAGGLLFDSINIFGNRRSVRYALVVDNGKVTAQFVEPDKIGVDVTSAESVYESL